jgi:hypothetical protein
MRLCTVPECGTRAGCAGAIEPEVHKARRRPQNHKFFSPLALVFGARFRSNWWSAQCTLKILRSYLIYIYWKATHGVQLLQISKGLSRMREKFTLRGDKNPITVASAPRSWYDREADQAHATAVVASRGCVSVVKLQIVNNQLTRLVLGLKASLGRRRVARR